MPRKSFLGLVVGILTWQPGLANEEITPELANFLGSVVSGIKADRVGHSPITGLYELAFGPNIFYVSKDGRYLVRGDLLHLKNGENLTEAKRNQGRLGAINALDESSMIVFAPKNAKHTITVFTDITCPYCQRMHRDMDQLHSLGIKVRYLAFPRAGVPSDVYDRMVSVWCADNPQRAMTDAKAGAYVEPKRCDNPVKDHYLLGQRLGIRGTPTLILKDGQMVPGYVAPNRLVQLIETGKTGLARQ